jgi:predicted nucleic acid-binding protein
MLDTGPLGKLAHPRPRADIMEWFSRLEGANAILIVPEIADFEVRRSLLAAGLVTARQALDRLKASKTYQPITTSAMLKAAELWADARCRGQPTADPKELDGDVILAAQAIESGAIVATENVGHLSRYVAAHHWSAIAP